MVTDFDLNKQKSFRFGQTYTAISRWKIYENVYWIGEVTNSGIKVNKDALLEYDRLELNDLVTTVKINAVLHDTLTPLAHNVRSLLKTKPH